MPIYDPLVYRGSPDEFNAVADAVDRLSAATEGSYVVYDLGDEGQELVSCSPYQGNSVVAHLTFKVAASRPPQDGDMVAVPNDQYRFPFNRNYWENGDPDHEFIIFDVAPDISGQWKAHAIRNIPVLGIGHRIAGPIGVTGHGHVIRHPEKGLDR